MQWEKHIVGIIWFVLIVFSMMASGRKLMRALKIEPITFSGEVSLSFAFGIPIVYFIIQVIGYAGLLKSYVLMGLVILGIILGRKELLRYVREIKQRMVKNTEGNYVQFIIGAILLCFFLLFFFISLSPVVLDDAEYFHYNHPQRFLDAERIYYIPNHLCSDYPWAHESLTLIGLGTGGETSANLFNWYIMFMCILLSLEIGAYFKIPEAGPAMAILIIGINSAWEFVVPGCVEPLLLFASIGAIHYTFNWISKSRRQDAILVGLNLGLLGATKYNGLMLVFFLFLICIPFLFSAKDRGIRLKQFGLMVLIFVVMIIPFEGRNLVVHHNPVYPFMHEALTGNIAPGADDVNTWVNKGVETTFVGGVKHYYELTTKTKYAYTSLAFTIFPLLLLLFIRRARVSVIAIYVLLHFAFTYILMPFNPRYMLPADAALIYLFMASVSYIKWKIPRQIFTLLLIVPFLMNMGMMYGVARERLPVAFGSAENEKAYLERTYSFYSSIFKMNELAGDDDLVWFLDRKGYRLKPYYIAFPDTYPDDWEYDMKMFHDTLVENDIDWVVLSRDHYNKAVSIDAILSSIRPGDADDIRLLWDDIVEKLDMKNVPEVYAGDIIFSMGAESPAPHLYKIDEDRIYANWPGLDFMSALASNIPEMSQQGYLDMEYMDGSGWIYRVVGE